MSPDLPPELWHKIARFIDPQDLRKLYALNSLFWEFAMDARYHHIHLSDTRSSRATAVKRMQHYRNPWVSHRVRHLEIHLATTNEDARKNTTMRATLRSSHDFSNLETFSKALSRCVLSMPKTRIQHLTLVISYPDFWRTKQSDIPRLKFLEYIEEILPFLRRSLFHLHLQCPNFIVEHILTSAPLFPLLTSLSLYILNSQRGIDGDCPRAVSSFLRKKSGSISRVQLTSGRFGEEWNPLFGQPLDLPSLTTLELNCSLQLDDQTDRFLRLHSPRITSLICPIPGFLRHSFEARCTWSRLNGLEIDKSSIYPSSDAIWCSFGLISQNLTSFSLIGYLEESEVEKLLPLLGNRSTRRNFQRLALCVERLTVKLIDQLFLNLPEISSLNLDIKQVVDEESVAVEPNAVFPFFKLTGRIYPPETNDFQAELRRRDYGTWKLQDLAIKLNKFTFIGRSELTRCWGLLKLFAECIPSIQSFEGSGNTGVPSYCKFELNPEPPAWSFG